MGEIDVLRQSDQEALSAFLDHNFHYPQGSSYFDDFPLWVYGTKTLRLGAFTKDRSIIGSAFVRLVDMKQGGATYQAAIIGGIAIDESCRGRGYASKLLSTLSLWAEERGALCAFLWSEDRSLYRRGGFELCGEQSLCPLAESHSICHAPHVAIQQITAADIWPRIKRQVGCQLEKNDAAWFMQQQTVAWYSYKNAYIGYGRGRDLSGIIHEWGGPQDELLPLCRAFMKSKPQAKMLLHPRDKELFGFSSIAVMPLAMARIFDPQKLVQCHYPQLPAQGVRHHTQWEFSVGLLSWMLTDQELVRLFFGPWTALQTEPPLFPLPLWIWGLDAA